MYQVKEIFYSIQGEGYHAGRPAVFCRFAGCNLWSGRPEDQATSVCSFCDTDFVGTDGTDGGCYETARQLAEKLSSLWPGDAAAKPFLVCTGGEPLLQMDDALVTALHETGFEIAVETNGTLCAPTGIDWLCVSPKAGAVQKLTAGDELKLVYPQTGILPESYEAMHFSHFYLQPMDGPLYDQARDQTLAYVLENPVWRISLQLHKMLNIR